MNRRGFLVISLSGLALSSFKDQKKLCFSTLGCPTWDWQKIIEKAAENGYGGKRSED